MEPTEVHTMAYAYGPVYPSPQPQRPVAVTVIGILFIIFGAMGLLGLPINILYMATNWRLAGPMGEAMMANDLLRTYMWVQVPVGFVLSLLYLASGIGMLQLRPWARMLAIGIVIFGMIAPVINSIVMVPALMSGMTDAMASAVPTGGPDLSFIGPLMMASVGLGVALGIGIMVVLLIFLTRPNVRAAFEQAPAPYLTQ